MLIVRGPGLRRAWRGLEDAVSGSRNATIYYGGFAFRAGGAFMHARLLGAELQRAGHECLFEALRGLLGRLLNGPSPP